MINSILGSKVKMAQTYVEGSRVPVTKVTAGPCVVTQIKRADKDGYWAVQIAFGAKKVKNTTKPMLGHMKAVLQKDSKFAPKYIREFQVKEEPTLKVGDTVKASDIFVAGDKVSVTGKSKGKGFAGGVKRWHFSGGPKTHGQSDRQRAPGSIGQGTTPGRVYKGKHMAGRMGSDQIKVKGLKIVSVNSDTNEIEISGPIPGTVGSLVILERIGESKVQNTQDVVKEENAQS